MIAVLQGVLRFAQDDRSLRATAQPSVESARMNALPLILFFLAVATIGYRYYSAFLAAKVMTLDDSRVTPAHRFNDGQNYVPTNKLVLLGHHFAAISRPG